MRSSSIFNYIFRIFLVSKVLELFDNLVKDNKENRIIARYIK